MEPGSSIQKQLKALDSALRASRGDEQEVFRAINEVRLTFNSLRNDTAEWAAASLMVLKEHKALNYESWSEVERSTYISNAELKLKDKDSSAAALNTIAAWWSWGIVAHYEWMGKGENLHKKLRHAARRCCWQVAVRMMNAKLWAKPREWFRLKGTISTRHITLIEPWMNKIKISQVDGRVEGRIMHFAELSLEVQTSISNAESEMGRRCARYDDYGLLITDSATLACETEQAEAQVREHTRATSDGEQHDVLLDDLQASDSQFRISVIEDSSRDTNSRRRSSSLAPTYREEALIRQQLDQGVNEREAPATGSASESALIETPFECKDTDTQTLEYITKDLEPRESDSAHLPGHSMDQPYRLHNLERGQAYAVDPEGSGVGGLEVVYADTHPEPEHVDEIAALQEALKISQLDNVELKRRIRSAEQTAKEASDLEQEWKENEAQLKKGIEALTQEVSQLREQNSEKQDTSITEGERQSGCHGAGGQTSLPKTSGDTVSTAKHPQSASIRSGQASDVDIGTLYRTLEKGLQKQRSKLAYLSKIIEGKNERTLEMEQMLSAQELQLKLATDKLQRATAQYELESHKVDSILAGLQAARDSLRIQLDKTISDFAEERKMLQHQVRENDIHHQNEMAEERNRLDRFTSEAIHRQSETESKASRLEEENEGLLVELSRLKFEKEQIFQQYHAELESHNNQAAKRWESREKEVQETTDQLKSDIESLRAQKREWERGRIEMEASMAKKTDECIRLHFEIASSKDRFRVTEQQNKKDLEIVNQALDILKALYEHRCKSHLDTQVRQETPKRTADMATTTVSSINFSDIDAVKGNGHKTASRPDDGSKEQDIPEKPPQDLQDHRLNLELSVSTRASSTGNVEHDFVDVKDASVETDGSRRFGANAFQPERLVHVSVLSDSQNMASDATLLQPCALRDHFLTESQTSPSTSKVSTEAQSEAHGTEDGCERQVERSGASRDSPTQQTAQTKSSTKTSTDACGVVLHAAPKITSRTHQQGSEVYTSSQHNEESSRYFYIQSIEGSAVQISTRPTEPCSSKEKGATEMLPPTTFPSSLDKETTVAAAKSPSANTEGPLFASGPTSLAHSRRTRKDGVAKYPLSRVSESGKISKGDKASKVGRYITDQWSKRTLQARLSQGLANTGSVSLMRDSAAGTASDRSSDSRVSSSHSSMDVITSDEDTRMDDGNFRDGRGDVNMGEDVDL